MDTWEPAKYLFNVGHLTETWTAGWWTRWPLLESLTPGMNGGCWANEQTFVWTSWFKNDCIKNLNQNYGANYFDATTVGYYTNFDFLYDGHAVSVVSSASVQYSNNTPIWGATYEDVNLGSANGYEDIFISGIKSGWAFEFPCQDSEQEPPSDPDPQLASGNPECNDGSCVSPIIIDVRHDGFALTSAADGVDFDLDADGVQERVAWTTSGGDDAFLALDRNGNGRIDDGSELFGNFTPVPGGGHAGNGFVALRLLDGSPSAPEAFDGVIDEFDGIFPQLLLWTDRNHDGISAPDELASVTSASILAFRTEYKTARRRDQHGNEFRQRAKAIWPDKDAYVYDVWLRRQ